MRTIDIVTEPLPPSYRWDYSHFVGGTHEFVVETAEYFVRNGFDVNVWYDGKPGEQNGVYYYERRLYEKFAPREVVIACNTTPALLGEQSIYWSNLWGDTSGKHPEFTTKVVVSNFHRESFGEAVVIPHACWPKDFEGGVKDPYLCLYSSSPDRGGDFLREIWPRVHKETGAILQETYQKDITEETMKELYRKSTFWLHPAHGVELFCISAQKALAAHCIPVYEPNMALQETVQWGVRATKETYADVLIQTIKNPPHYPEVHIPDWDEVSKAWLGIIH